MTDLFHKGGLDLNTIFILLVELQVKAFFSIKKLSMCTHFNELVNYFKSQSTTIIIEKCHHSKTKNIKFLQNEKVL